MYAVLSGGDGAVVAATVSAVGSFLVLAYSRVVHRDNRADHETVANAVADLAAGQSEIASDVRILRDDTREARADIRDLRDVDRGHAHRIDRLEKGEKV